MPREAKVNSSAVTTPARWAVSATTGKLSVVLLAEAMPAYQRALASRHWPEGTELTLRVEPAAEAWRHSDMKHLFGHFIAPLAEETSGSVIETKEMLKALFMPEGKSSLTELSREELRAFTDHVERFIIENAPDVLALGTT
ncbi:MAG: hypothetical protein ABL982_00130 [Vicinamibacterales bacterium]